MFLNRDEIERIQRREGVLADTKARMDFFYREQRHNYDWSRRFYLWGRDTLLNKIEIPDRGSVLEVGCGTARNLIKLARQNHTTQFYGLDASSLMLETARSRLRELELESRITLKLGLAETWSYRTDFSLQKPFDAILFFYSLSMMDDWKAALSVACRNLGPSGRLYVVDFGDHKGMPSWYRRLGNLWFEHFAFNRLFEIPDYFTQLERAGHGCAQVITIGRGHATAVIFTPIFAQDDQNPNQR
jgi:S-adenosylmethionine-diacylgycerolhomoserine-N-methlytransferase